MSRRRAFTLIELLVVIGVIVLLLAILMPALGKARDAANAVKCSANVRTLTQSFLLFARDHDGHLPGTRRTWRAPDGNPDHLDWLYGQYGAWDQYPGKTMVDRLQCAPQYGTIWKYVNDPDVYRCPSMKVEKPGSGIGSNGRFDYAAFAIFCGASVRNINAISQLHHPAMIRTVTKDDSGNVTVKDYPPLMSCNDPLVLTPGFPTYDANLANDPMRMGDENHPGYSDLGFAALTENLPTPLVCQEEPAISINYDPADPYVHHDTGDDDDWWGQMDGSHQRWDQMAHCHSGGSYYGAIDGSVQFVIEPDTDESNGALSNKNPSGRFAEGSILWWQKGPATHIPRPLNWDCGGWWTVVHDPGAGNDTSKDTYVWHSGWNYWSKM